MKRKNSMWIEGGTPLRGSIRVSGSKNSALPCLFATLLTDDPCTLENVPRLDDIETTCALLTYLGKKISRKGNSITVLSGRGIHTEAPYDLVRKMRASVLVLGPILARRGQASASLPGGCAIGNRPINLHLSGLEKLGAQNRFSKGMIRLSAKKLTGRKINLSFPSVGATENLLMASVLAEGKTVISQAAKEPEIIDCAEFLNKMGAKISGAGTETITIQGRKALHGATHKVIPDRIETATYLIAAAATKGHLELEGTCSRHLTSVIKNLKRTGLDIQILKDLRSGMESIRCSYRKALKPVSTSTAPFPGFPTDVQAQWMALMSITEGHCTIKESVFENRYLHAAELNRMGAKIRIHDGAASVQGIQRLSGAHVMVSDLRAGAALFIAGLAAQGKTFIHRMYHLDRGYENLEGKLRQAGATVRRIH